MDTVSGDSGTNLLSSVDDKSKLVANDSNKTNFPNLLFIRINGINYSGGATLDGVAQGQVIDILVTRRSGVITHYIDGAIVGTSPGSTITWSPELISDNGTSTRSLGVISNVGFVDYNELSKGDYLLGNNTAHTNVNIPIAIGDTVEFDCIFGDTSTSVGLFDGRATTNIDGALSDTFMVLDGDGTYNMGTGNCFVDGVSVDTNDTYPTDGLLHKISFVATQNGYIDTIGAVSTSKANRCKGTIANFNVNNGEYVFALNNITLAKPTYDFPNMAIAPQTGTATDGSQLLNNSSFDLTTGWTEQAQGTGSSTTMSGNGVLTLVSGPSGFNDRADRYQNGIAMVTGEVFKLVVEVVSKTDNLVLMISDNTDTDYASNTNVVVGTNVLYFVATSDTVGGYVRLREQSIDGTSVISSCELYKVTTGVIPVFDEDTNLISYASNETYYPFNETVAGDNYEVLAYEGPQRDAWNESGTLNLSTGWTDLGDGSFSCDTADDYKAIDNRDLALGNIADGSTAIVKYEVYDYEKGAVDAIVWSDDLYSHGPDVAANGFYESQFDLTVATGTSDNNRVGFRSRDSVDGFTGKIRNITIEIVPESWVGPEVFVNGDFSDGVTDWNTTSSSSTITDDGGVLKAEKIGTSSSWMARSSNNLSPTVAGKTYIISATISADVGNTGVNPVVTLYDNGGAATIVANISKEDIAAGYTFVAPSDRTNVILGQGTGAVIGDIFYLDDVTITEKVDGAWSTAPQLINEFDGTTYIHAMNDVVDNGGTTAYLPQTGNATSPTSYLRGQVADFTLAELGGQTISYPLDEDTGSTFLLGAGSAYTDVSIDLVAGDTVEFDCIFGDTTNAVGLFDGRETSDNTFMVLQADGTYNLGTGNYLVDGVSVQNTTTYPTDGLLHRVSFVATSDGYIDTIGAVSTKTNVLKGTIANFNVNNGEYVYAMDDIVDNGDGTATAPQTGTTAEYGSNLLVGDNTSFDSSIGSWYATNSSVIDLSWDTSGSMLMTRLTSGWVSVYTGNAILAKGKVYSIDIDVDFSSGSGFQNLYVYLGGNELGKIPTTHVGTLTFTGVSDADTAFRLYHKDNSTSQTGLIKSVVVRETSNGLIPVYNAVTNTSALYSKNLGDVTAYYAYDEDGERYSHYDGAWSAENKLLDPTATLSSGNTYFDNITVSEAVTISARTVELRLSSADTSTNDTALIEYFSKYLVPLGTTFTITRE